jgi:DNA-directed RNA polymerase specialized sigma24 family protein
MTDHEDLERRLEEDVRAVYESLVRFWLKRGVSLEDAQDAAQEGAFKAFIKHSKWEGKSQRRTFMIAVGKRAGIDYFRKENRRARIGKRSDDHESE